MDAIKKTKRDLEFVEVIISKKNSEAPSLKGCFSEGNPSALHFKTPLTNL